MIDKKYLIKELEGLSAKLVPDRKWKKAQRQILLSQWRSQVEEVPGLFQLEKEYVVFKAFRWLLKPVLMLLVFVLGSGYLGVWASENSLPGDLLYPIKITSEKIQVKLTFDEHKKTELHVELAKKRTDEIKQLKQKETVDTKVIKETYTKIKEEVNEAKNTLQVIQDKKVSESKKLDAVTVLTSAEKMDEALRNIDESLKNNIGGPVDDEENQLLTDTLIELENLKANVSAVVKDTVTTDPSALSNSSEANEAINKIIERESKELSNKADTLSPAINVDEIDDDTDNDLLKEEDREQTINNDDNNLLEGENKPDKTKSSTNTNEESALKNNAETKSPATTSSIIEGQANTSNISTSTSTATSSNNKISTNPTAVAPANVEIKDEEVNILLSKVEDLLKNPLSNAQLTEAKALNNQLMLMVNQLVNLGKSDKALLLLEASKKLLKAMEVLLKPVNDVTPSAVLPASTTISVETQSVNVSTLDLSSTSVPMIPATGVDTTTVQDP